ncbi:hypothetical protein BSLG_008171 [Batrachochytrium salamandrivorans]|nr:hypothetical protein BSLG_008171 [Batrachochytrium salamandrivorans]
MPVQDTAARKERKACLRAAPLLLSQILRFIQQHAVKIPLRQLLVHEATASSISLFDKQLSSLAEIISPETPLESFDIASAISKNASKLPILLRENSPLLEVHKQYIETLVDITRCIQSDLVDFPADSRVAIHQFLSPLLGSITSKSGRTAYPTKIWSVDSSSVHIDYNTKIGLNLLGRVFKGECGGLEVCIQLISGMQGQEALDAFSREAEAWFLLHHPNVVKIWRVCLNTDTPFIIMPLMRADVSAYLRCNASTNMETRIGFIVGIAKGLKYLHSQTTPIVHGNVKASNILFGFDGNVAITDVGMSRTKSLSNAGTGRHASTIRWLAPERYKRGYQLAQPSDTFGFAMTCWEVLTGHIPFSEEREDDIVKDWIKEGERPDKPDDVSPLLWQIMCDCWHQDPEKRPTFDNIVMRLSVLPYCKGPVAEASPLMLPVPPTLQMQSLSSPIYDSDLMSSLPPTILKPSESNSMDEFLSTIGSSSSPSLPVSTTQTVQPLGDAQSPLNDTASPRVDLTPVIEQPSTSSVEPSSVTPIEQPPSPPLVETASVISVDPPPTPLIETAATTKVDLMEVDEVGEVAEQGVIEAHEISERPLQQPSASLELKLKIPTLVSSTADNSVSKRGLKQPRVSMPQTPLNLKRPSLDRESRIKTKVARQSISSLESEYVPVPAFTPLVNIPSESVDTPAKNAPLETPSKIRKPSKPIFVFDNDDMTGIRAGIVTETEFQNLLEAFPQVTKKVKLTVDTFYKYAGTMSLDTWLAFTPVQRPRIVTNRDKRIVALRLINNEARGGFTQKISRLSLLEGLQLVSNQSPTMVIPREIGNLKKLKILCIDNCALVGPIPAELGNLRDLYELKLTRAKICDSIPAQIGRLANLTTLDLSNNKLSGSIPKEIGNLTSLVKINLSQNLISGSIPPELSKLTELTECLIGGCRIEGIIPTEFGKLVKMERLDLHRNYLDGPIPLELTKMVNIKYLDLSFNHLDLPIADEFYSINFVSVRYDQRKRAKDGTIKADIEKPKSIDAMKVDQPIAVIAESVAAPVSNKALVSVEVLPSAHSGQEKSDAVTDIVPTVPVRVVVVPKAPDSSISDTSTVATQDRATFELTATDIPLVADSPVVVSPVVVSPVVDPLVVDPLVATDTPLAEMKSSPLDSQYSEEKAVPSSTPLTADSSFTMVDPSPANDIVFPVKRLRLVQSVPESHIHAAPIEKNIACLDHVVMPNESMKGIVMDTVNTSSRNIYQAPQIQRLDTMDTGFEASVVDRIEGSGLKPPTFPNSASAASYDAADPVGIFPPASDSDHPIA